VPRLTVASLSIMLLLFACAPTAQTGNHTHKRHPRHHMSRVSHAQGAANVWNIGWHADFWDSLADLCAGIEQGAADVLAANGSSNFDAAADVGAMAGHHDVAKGTRVVLLGHDTRTCFHSQLTATHILVQDPSSPLNQRRGYIASGFLKR
jgi:hypothetical protein